MILPIVAYGDPVLKKEVDKAWSLVTAAKDKEIETIKEWLHSGDTAEISITQYQIGQKIKLDSGPFCEQNAVVKDITKTHYVLILESLGYVLKVKHK